MKRTKTKPTSLAKLYDALGNCLTPESAKRIVALKADKQIQARINYLADRCTEGLLTPEEDDEYGSIVRLGTMISILQSKSRQLLAKHSKSQ